MSDLLRVAVAGAGKAGSLLARCLPSHPRSTVVRICSGSDESARRLAEELGISPWGHDYAEGERVLAVGLRGSGGGHRGYREPFR